MIYYMNSSQLKKIAKEQLAGKRQATLVPSFISLLLFYASYAIQFIVPGNIVLTEIFSFLLVTLNSIFTYGLQYFYLKFIFGQSPIPADAFHGFRSQTGTLLIINTVIHLPFTVIFTLLAIPANRIATAIPFSMEFSATFFLVTFGAMIVMVLQNIVLLMFSQIHYLMNDFPGHNFTYYLKQSMQLMKGHKLRLFYIQLSFIPWFLLGYATCGLALLWVYPYINTVFANFYVELINRQPKKLQNE